MHPTSDSDLDHHVERHGRLIIMFVNILSGLCSAGSIVVHLLSEEARKLYDLETLWTKDLQMEVVPQA